MCGKKKFECQMANDVVKDWIWKRRMTKSRERESERGLFAKETKLMKCNAKRRFCRDPAGNSKPALRVSKQSGSASEPAGRPPESLEPSKPSELSVCGDNIGI